MRKWFVVAMVAVLLLMNGTCTTGAVADDTITIPATYLGKAYRNDPSGGLDSFVSTEELRCLAILFAFYDWQNYDSSANFLLNYAYVGKDKEGEILWIGLGEKKSSMVMMYAPKIDSYNYTCVPVAMSGTWVNTFIDVYCDPLYHIDSNTLKSLVNTSK